MGGQRLGPCAMYASGGSMREFQPLAEATDGTKRHAMRLELAAQARDIDLDGIGRDLAVPARERLQQLVLAGGLGRVDQQVFQHGPFAWAQVDGQQLSLAFIVLRRLARRRGGLPCPARWG